MATTTRDAQRQERIRRMRAARTFISRQRGDGDPSSPRSAKQAALQGRSQKEGLLGELSSALTNPGQALSLVTGGLSMFDAFQQNQKNEQFQFGLGNAFSGGMGFGQMFDEQGIPQQPFGPSLLQRSQTGFDQQAGAIRKGFTGLERLTQGRRDEALGGQRSMNRQLLRSARLRRDAMGGGLGKLDTAFTTARRRNLGFVDKMGKQERRDIGTRFDALNAQTGQRMTDLGLGATTVGSSLRSGNERRRSDSLRGLSGQLAQLRSGIDQSFTGQQLGARERGLSTMANLRGDVTNTLGAGLGAMQGLRSGFGAERMGLAGGRMNALLMNQAGGNQASANIAANNLNYLGQNVNATGVDNTNMNAMMAGLGEGFGFFGQDAPSQTSSFFQGLGTQLPNIGTQALMFL